MSSLCDAIRREPELALVLGWHTLLEIRRELAAARIVLDVWNTKSMWNTGRISPETAVTILILGAWGVAPAARELKRKLHKAPYEFVAAMGEVLHEIGERLTKPEVLTVIAALAAYERHLEAFMWAPVPADSAQENPPGHLLCPPVIPIDVRALVFDESQNEYVGRVLAETPAVGCFLKMDDSAALLLVGDFLEFVCAGAVTGERAAYPRAAGEPVDICVSRIRRQEIEAFGTPHWRVEEAQATVDLLCFERVTFHGVGATQLLSTAAGLYAGCAQVAMERNRNLRPIAAASAVQGWHERRAFERTAATKSQQWTAGRVKGYALNRVIKDEDEARKAYEGGARKAAALTAELEQTRAAAFVGEITFRREPHAKSNFNPGHATMARRVHELIGMVAPRPFALEVRATCAFRLPTDGTWGVLELPDGADLLFPPDALRAGARQVEFDLAPEATKKLRGIPAGVPVELRWYQYGVASRPYVVGVKPRPRGAASAWRVR